MNNKKVFNEDIFECKLYITDLETNKKSKEINILDLIFNEDLEFEFGNYEDNNYETLPYKDFKFFANDYSVTFYSPQYHKLKSNWDKLKGYIRAHIEVCENKLTFIGTCNPIQETKILQIYQLLLDEMINLETKGE